MTLQGVEAAKTTVGIVATLPAGSPEDDALLALLAQIAAGSETSRLERALQQEPAVPHEPAAGSLHFRGDGRMLELRVPLGPTATPEETAKRLLATLRSLGTIGGAELAAARTALLTQEASQLEQLHYYALFQGDRLWPMPAGFTPRYLAALESADAKDLGAMAQRLLASAGVVQIVGAGPGLAARDVETASSRLAALRAPSRTSQAP